MCRTRSNYTITYCNNKSLIPISQSQVRQCDPGPANICVNCYNHLENWEEFKQKCITSNECIKEYLKKIKEEKLSLTKAKPVKLEDQPEIDEQDNNYDNVSNNEVNTQDSGNDLPISKSLISITVMALLQLVIIT